MTIEARFNLQSGVKENKMYEGTTYNIEDALDRYIVQTNLFKASAQANIEDALQEYLQSVLDNILIGLQDY